jgi:hypothetical protein
VVETKTLILAGEGACAPQFGFELGIGIGSGFGWPKGGPSMAQGPPKRGARVEWKKCFVCNKRREKAGWGREDRRHRRDRVTSPESERQNLTAEVRDAEKNKDLPLICADGR